MDWCALIAPVPLLTVQLSAGSMATVIATLLAVVPLLMLAARQALRRVDAAAEIPQLRIIDGGRELNRRAA